MGIASVTFQTRQTDVEQARAVPAQPRARGELMLSAKAAPHGNVLSDLRQAGAFKVLFPRPRAKALDAMFVNTAGGVTGGDRFNLSARAEAGSELTLTTQACERAYRAQPSETGVIRTRLQVDAGARVNWLPQETILFEGCRLDRALRVDLAPDARLLLVEPLIIGRAAMGEEVRDGHLQDRIEVTRDGHPIFVDSIRLSGDIAAHMDRPAIGNGARAMASVLFVAPEAEAHLDTLRDMLPATGGASLIKPDILFLRVLAPDGHALRRTLLPVLDRLTGQALPICWRL